jgi:uncharacterized membrane-anchored protein YhcB (DUF1043 family)
MNPYERIALVAGLVIGAIVASIWLNELIEKLFKDDDDSK